MLTFSVLQFPNFSHQLRCSQFVVSVIEYHWLNEPLQKPGHTTFVETMLGKGNNIKQFEDSAGNALLDAINRGKARLAKFILDAAEDEDNSLVNYCDFRGKTPLIRSLYILDEKARNSFIQLLLSRNADPNLQDDEGRTALSYACELILKDVIKILVRSNADPNILDKNGISPLMYCAKVGNEAGIGILLKSFRRLGLNVDQTSSDGYTALHFAAINKNVYCAAKLSMDGYASVTKVDMKYGKTAEEWARLKGCRTPEIAMFSTSSQKLQRLRYTSRIYPKSLFVSTKCSPTHSQQSFSKSLNINFNNRNEKLFLNKTVSDGQLLPIKSSPNKKSRNSKNTSKKAVPFKSDAEKELHNVYMETKSLSKSLNQMNIVANPNLAKNSGTKRKESQSNPQTFQHRHSQQYSGSRKSLISKKSHEI